MSLSNPTVSANPASKFIHFKGDVGKWFYWDKQKEENIEVPLPISFIILDELSTIKGWSEVHKSNIYSNEIHHLNETLIVRTFKGGAMIKGWYAEIKNDIKAIGGKYVKSIYAMVYDENGDTDLVNFQLSGAAFSAYLDVKIKPNNQAVGIMEETEKAKKGSVEYLMPVFKPLEMDEGLRQQAIEMDIELQEYLKSYKVMKENEVVEKAEVSENDTLSPGEMEEEFKQKDEKDPDYKKEDENDLPF